MKEFDQRNVEAGRARLDDETRLVAMVEWLKSSMRRVEIVVSYAAIVAGIVLLVVMVGRCVPATYHYLTASPAPRSPAQAEAATPQPRAIEAGVRSTGEGR